MAGRASAAVAKRVVLSEVSILLKGHPIESKKSLFVGHLAVGVPDKGTVADFRAWVLEHTCDAEVTHGFMHAYILPDGSVGGGDDGEKGAQQCLQRVLRKATAGNSQLAGLGVVAGVCRWYGGVPMGSKRFHVIGSSIEALLPNALSEVHN